MGERKKFGKNRKNLSQKLKKQKTSHKFKGNLIKTIEEEPAFIASDIIYFYPNGIIGIKDYIIHWTTYDREDTNKGTILLSYNNGQVKDSFIRALEEKYDIQIPKTRECNRAIREKIGEMMKEYYTIYPTKSKE